MSRRIFGAMRSFGPGSGRTPDGTAPSGGGAIVPPDAISGLALWTDPSDLSTVNQRGSGTAATYPLVTLDDKASGVGSRSAGQQYWSCFNNPTSTTINGRTAIEFKRVETEKEKLDAAAEDGSSPFDVLFGG